MVKLSRTDGAYEDHHETPASMVLIQIWALSRVNFRACHGPWNGKSMEPQTFRSNSQGHGTSASQLMQIRHESVRLQSQECFERSLSLG